MRKTFRWLLFLVIFGWTASSPAQQRLSPPEAKHHVGEYAMVCGKAVSTHYARGSKGQPTFINLDRPYPSNIFTIVIFGDDRSKFGNPEQSYSGKWVSVTGTIKLHREVPEIVANDPAVIGVQ